MGKKQETVTCVGCGKEAEFDGNNVQHYEINGFTFLWDRTMGLDMFPICLECYDELKVHINAIEGILKRNIGDVAFN